MSRVNSSVVECNSSKVVTRVRFPFDAIFLIIKTIKKIEQKIRKFKITLIMNSKVYGCILVSPMNRYLLVQGRKTEKWSFPKGHPNENEQSLECAKRELYEETGIKAPFMYSDVYELAFGTYYMYNTREEINCNIQDSNEIIQTQWFTKEQMRKISTNVDVNTFLRQKKKKFRYISAN